MNLYSMCSQMLSFSSQPGVNTRILPISRDPVHKDKFKAFLKGYTLNGGTALQINMLDPGMLKDAQDHPQNYRHLLVRITGYNAYFTTVGRELQNEVIERVSHNKF